MTFNGKTPNGPICIGKAGR